MHEPNLPPKAIIGHRGANAYAPENTLSSFRLAIEQGAHGIELDTHLTSDGEVVVLHDEHLDRTTNGKGRVYEHTLAELRQLDAGGEPIPTLIEVLDLLDGRLVLNIELKGFSRQALRLPGTVCRILENYPNQQILFSSFNPRLLVRTRACLPEAALGLLLTPEAIGWMSNFIAAPLIKPWSLHPHAAMVSPAYIKRAHRANRKVIAYTVNQPDQMRHLFKIGIDGIITDDPTTGLREREF